MASKVSSLNKIYGRDNYDPGAHMYHAADGVAGGGRLGKEERHRIKKALRQMRLRASGATDDILGSKEGGGSLENKHEQVQ